MHRIACGMALCTFLLSAACTSDDGAELGSDGGVDPSGDGGVGPDATDWNAPLDEVLPEDHVAEIELSFAQGEWETMLEEWDFQQQKNYHPADFSFDGEVLANIGVRLKGYSSLLFGPGGNPFDPLDPDSKLPLKLNFNKFGSERFHLVDRINLGNNVFDRSYMRERLSSRTFAAMGVPVARSSYASVSVDERYLGVYTVVQQVDKLFLRQHFGEANNADDGNLYKCVPNEIGTCSLQWIDGDPNSYHHSHSCNIGYEECGLVLKTNEDDVTKNDYSDLVHLLDVINNTPNEGFADAIEEVFDVDSFLRLTATNIAMSNFDSYFGRLNNFYLYHRPDTGKFVMIPWDLNMSYGLYGCGGGGGGTRSMVSFDINDPVCREEAPSIPLLDRILDVPNYHATYLQYVREAAEVHLLASGQQAWINEFDAQLAPLLPNDPNYPNSMQEYRDSLSDVRNQNSANGGYNLMDFVIRRREYILSQF